MLDWTALHICCSILRMMKKRNESGLVGSVSLPLCLHTIKDLGGNAKKLCHLVDCHIWSANISKCASTTKSTTSSVAEHSNCSQNQSTARSAGAMVSNRKSCRSCRVWGSERIIFVLFMLLLLQTQVKWQLRSGQSFDRLLTLLQNLQHIRI